MSVFKKMISYNQHTRYNTGTAGTIADITDNSIYIMHVSTDAANGVFVTANYRFLFVDN